jgi:hypothetical protein
MTPFPAHASKAERYVGFLLTYLPVLQSHALFPEPDQEAKWRGSVLMQTIEHIASTPGLCLEFGVYQGGSITACAKRYPDRTFYGFDSFEGFPDDGRRDWDQDFAVAKLPEVPTNVKLIRGWFSDTLPPFLDAHPEPIAFINIDCDIYSSTSDVFNILRRYGRLKPGIVISFDELINYHGFIINEMLALFELLEATGIGIDWVCCHKHVRLAQDSIRLRQSKAYPPWNDDLATGYRQQASLVLTNRGIDYSILGKPHVRRYIAKLASVIESWAPTQLRQ